jgi:hypothetical protein
MECGEDKRSVGEEWRVRAVYPARWSRRAADPADGEVIGIWAEDWGLHWRVLRCEKGEVTV